MRWLDALHLVIFPLQVVVIAVGAGFFVAGCLLLIPVMLVTMPVWLPINVYFTKYWRAKERADRAYAELATTVLLDSMRDPTKRQRYTWWQR